MNKTLSFDVTYCLDKIYGRMKDNYAFAYPDDNFDSNRAHQVLCRFGVFHDSLITIFSKENMVASNELEEVFFQQIIGNAKVIAFDKQWAYPNKTISEARAPSALNCIESSLKNYRNSIQLLGKYCFKEKKAQFNLLNFIENTFCADFYNYAYPNNHYSEGKAHPAFQMLLTLTENVTFVMESIKTNDEDLQKILNNAINKMSHAKEYLIAAYPNNSFNKEVGHECLSKFIHEWKNFKEFSVNSLKTYFEKQELIQEYEAKLNHHNQVNNPINTNEEKMEEPVPEIIKPVIRKVKSLL